MYIVGVFFKLSEIILRIIDVLKSFFSPEIVIFFVSMIPVLELRGGLIAASLLGIDWRLAMFICIVGNLLPIPFIILFIKKIFEYLKKTKFSNFVQKLEKKANKSSEKILKYEKLGLYFFVAIPLPGTGAWTGALVASLFGMNVKNAFFSILLGVFTAAVIMAIFSYGILKSVIPI